MDFKKVCREKFDGIGFADSKQLQKIIFFAFAGADGYLSNLVIIDGESRTTTRTSGNTRENFELNRRQFTK